MNIVKMSNIDCAGTQIIVFGRQSSAFRQTILSDSFRIGGAWGEFLHITLQLTIFVKLSDNNQQLFKIKVFYNKFFNVFRVITLFLLPLNHCSLLPLN